MITTTPVARPAVHASVLPTLHAAWLAARKQATRLFYRFVEARIATECNGPVRALRRRGSWSQPL